MCDLLVGGQWSKKRIQHIIIAVTRSLSKSEKCGSPHNNKHTHNTRWSTWSFYKRTQLQTTFKLRSQTAATIPWTEGVPISETVSRPLIGLHGGFQKKTSERHSKSQRLSLLTDDMSVGRQALGSDVVHKSSTSDKVKWSTLMSRAHRETRSSA